MRRYRKPYQNSKALAGAPRKKKALQLPEWDSTQHDLNTLKLTPEQLERRHQERVSKHHISLKALAARQANQRETDGHAAEESGTAAQQQQREQPAAAPSSDHDDVSLSSGSSSGSEDDAQQGAYQQRYREELAAFRHELEASSDSEDVVLLDIGNQRPAQQQQQQQQQRQQQHWQGKQQEQQGLQAQPHKGKAASQRAAAVAVTRANGASTDVGANAHKQSELPAATGSDADGNTKAFDQQVQELQQHLAEERAANEQLRSELHDYMAHAGSVIAQLQQQVQQLTATGIAAAGASPAKQQHQQQTVGRQAAHGSSSPYRLEMGTAAADTTQQPGSLHSGARHSALYPAPWHSSCATAAGTASYGASYSSSADAAAATAASLQQRLARFKDEGGAVPTLGVTAEQAVLPSYAEMRRGNAAAVASGPYVAGPWSAGSPATSPQRHGAQAQSHNPLRSSAASVTDLFSRPVAGPSDRPPYSRPGTAPAHDPTATLLSISASSSHQRWSNAAQAPFVVSSTAAEASNAAADGQLPPALAAKWSNSMPGLRDVDRHLGQGLPRSAVARLHAQGHYFEPMLLSQQYLHPAEAQRTLSLNAHVAAARAGREGAGRR